MATPGDIEREAHDFTERVVVEGEPQQAVADARVVAEQIEQSARVVATDEPPPAPASEAVKPPSGPPPPPPAPAGAPQAPPAPPKPPEPLPMTGVAVNWSDPYQLVGWVQDHRTSLGAEAATAAIARRTDDQACRIKWEGGVWHVLVRLRGELFVCQDEYLLRALTYANAFTAARVPKGRRVQ